ncbi:winged helix-turn-helix domain-containing protein [Enterobacter asburiae]|uniref:winged helix-turn-helix domain-containing protein n=1 Tax=Scandinavium sp. UTDF21-P1B TaxID=3446379 RepID=UPI00347A7202
MCFTYLLNDSVEFHPDENLLINKHNTQQQVSLSASSARCLLLLIKKRDIVTQNELFEYAWGNNAISATPNNLYQNISLLRKALKGLTSHNNSWIVTLPRKGFRLDESVVAEVIVVEKHTETVLPAVKNTVQEKPGSGDSFFAKFSHPQTAHLLTYLALVILLILGVVTVDYMLFPRTSIAEKFVFYKNVGACKVYFNKDTRSFKTHFKILDMLEASCRRNPYTYITIYPILHTATVLSCTVPVDSKDPQCTSSVIRGFISP